MIGNKVNGWGKIPCDHMIVGEGPGRQESIDQIPFCGASGAELDWLYIRRGAKMWRSDFYITNIVKWRTDEDDSDPTEDDIARDEEELKAEIIVVDPKIIVAVGVVAARWFMMKEDVDAEKYYGVPIECPRYPDKTLIISYHPAAAMRLPEKYYDKIFWTFQQIGKACRGELKIIVDNVNPIYVEYKGIPVLDGVIASDTEGSVEHPWGLSVSNAAGMALVAQQSDWSHADTVVMHSALHDIPVYEALKSLVDVDKVHDTMLLAYLQPWLPRGLKPLAFKLCGMEMNSYEEIISEAEAKISKGYLQKVLDYKQCQKCKGASEIEVPFKVRKKCTACAGTGKQHLQSVGGTSSNTEADGWFGEGAHNTTDVCRTCEGSGKYLPTRTTKCDECSGDGTTWPRPEPQLVFNDDGSAKVYKPRSIGRGIRSILERGDRFREGWLSVDETVRKTVEGELGGLREATLDDVEPRKKAVDYSARDADATLRVWNVLAPQVRAAGLWNVYEMDRGIIPIIDRMHRNGILIDKEYFHGLSKQFGEEQEKVIDSLSRIVGHRFNPSSPKQVSSLLYEDLKLKPIRNQTGTDEKTLEAIKIKYRDREDVQLVVDHITDYRELTKLKGTYTDALPLQAKEDGRIHTQFLLHVTTSGRLASRDPNIQNQPTRTDRGKLIRKGFIAKEGCNLVSVDLDQVELRVVSHLAEEANMIEIFQTGKDIHRATASLIYAKPMEEISTQERLLSKTINFGILYGMSAKRLYNELSLLGINVTLDDCIGFINDWFRAYPGIKEYMDRCHSQAKDMGYVECLFGRRRYLPGVWSAIDRTREESLRWAGNHPVQATAAGLLKLWMRRVWDEVLPRIRMESQSYVEPLATVHDELIFECQTGLEAQLITLVVQEALNCANLLVPISAKGGYGRDWSCLK